jgi:hypothetical protein
MELCEYNPKKKSPATNPPGKDDCKNESFFVVGKMWHLCKDCAALPQFARMKKKPLSKGS